MGLWIIGAGFCAVAGLWAFTARGFNDIFVSGVCGILGGICLLTSIDLTFDNVAALAAAAVIAVLVWRFPWGLFLRGFRGGTNPDDQL